jgi:alpha-beta hydrolase superfamily lysophospholipase
MYNAWAEVRDQVLNAVGQAQQANPDYRVVSAGHSLGAGIATFAAAELRNAGFITDMVCCYTALLSWEDG